MSHSQPASSSAHLRVDGLSHSYAERRVLTDISFTVSAGERIGLIGENGSGKSTVLRIIAGLLEPDGGVIAVHPGGAEARIGLLHQEPPFAPADTVATALETAVAPIRRAAAELDAAGVALGASPDDAAVADRFAATLESAERLEAWSVDARIAAMLDGLGLADLPRDRPTGELSGGQRARLSLAWLLLSRPEVLLLDEPTNHLDDAATRHLLATLTECRGPVLLASHDRAFLDDAVTGLIDLDPAPVAHSVSAGLVGDGQGSGIGVTRFTGRYSDYLMAREDARDRWERDFAAEQAELKRLAASVRDSHSVGHAGRPPRTEGGSAKKFYADRNAKVVARRVNDAKSRLDELAARQLRRPPLQLRFRGLDAAGAAPSRATGLVLSAADVSVEGRLASTTFDVNAGERWLITGGNGSGKSTLLLLLAGRLEPDAGAVTRFGGVRVGLLAQDAELTAELAAMRVRDAYAALVGADRAEAVPLGAFGLIAGRDEERTVASLSGGQRRRLALAAVLADPPDVLLLDEPTNHLSLLLVAELERAIPDYPGAVVVASHDRWLRRQWRGERLELGTAAA